MRQKLGLIFFVSSLLVGWSMNLPAEDSEEQGNYNFKLLGQATARTVGLKTKYRKLLGQVTGNLGTSC